MEPDDQDQKQAVDFCYANFIERLSNILQHTKPVHQYPQNLNKYTRYQDRKQRRKQPLSVCDQLRKKFPSMNTTKVSLSKNSPNQDKIELNSKQQKIMQQLSQLTDQVTFEQKAEIKVQQVEQILTESKQNSYLQHQGSEQQQFSQTQHKEQSQKQHESKAEQIKRNIRIFYNYVPIPQTKEQAERINQCFKQNTTRQKLLTPNYNKSFIGNMYQSYKQRAGLKSRQSFINFLKANTLHAIKLDNIKKSI